MPMFRYKGRGARGDLRTGQIEAASADAVANQLLATGVTPIDIVEGRGRGAGLGLGGALFSPRPSLTDLIIFGRQMYTLMKSGVPITRGMQSLIESSRNRILVETLKDVELNLESGRDLAASLARHPRVFSPLFISMVRVGETTGRLDEAFLRITQYLEADKDTRERVKTALRYPMIVVTGIAIAMGIINYFVIPQFTQLFVGQNIELPWQTRTIVAVSDFTVAYWWLIAVSLGAIWLAVYVYVRTEAGRFAWDRTKLRIPIVGSIVHRATMARFARAFSIALRAGVPLVQGLTVVARAVGNEYICDHVLSMRNGIERGDTLTRTAATTGLFTPIVIQMLAIGEETGAVDELLSEAADFYEREVDYDLKYLGDAIQPILLVFLGGMVLVLMMAVVLPVWDLAAKAR